MAAVMSGYFPCVSIVLAWLFIATGSRFLMPDFLNLQNYSFFSLITSSSRFFECIIIIYVSFVGNKSFVIGTCSFTIVVINILNSNLIFC